MTTSEFEIIDRYFKPISHSRSPFVTLGPGDDCALLTVPQGSELCVSTDTLISGVHFPAAALPIVIADRLMAANLSDLAAMGAEPLGFVLALTLPEADNGWLEAFSARLAELIQRYNISLVGGNLSRGALSLTMTVLGLTPTGEAIRRSTASVGQGVYVTGTLGDAGEGLKRYQDGVRDGYLVARYTSPTPRLEAGRGLAGIATAMIDVSDGLVADLTHLARASDVGATLIASDIPLSEELIEAVGADEALHLALSHGDDYELCFSAPLGQSSEIEALSARLGLRITQIGVLTSSNNIEVRDHAGNAMDLADSGYQHF